jgi:uncharacterized protein (UPF0333 family)
MKRRKGQSILEYVIIFAVIVAGIIYAATKFIKPAVEQGMNDTAKAMESATARIKNIGGTPEGGTP